MMKNFKNYLENLQNRISEFNGKINLIKEENQNLEQILKEYKEEKEVLEELIILIEKFNLIKQQVVLRTINKYATSILSIIDENLELQAEFEIKANRTQLNLFIKDKKSGIKSDLFDFGGSLVHLVSIIFKIILLDVLKPGIPIILDEPATYVNRDNQIKLGQFLFEICQKYNKQIIIITHIDALKSFANNIIEIKKNGIYAEVN